MVTSRQDWGGSGCDEVKPKNLQVGRKRKAPKWQPWKRDVEPKRQWPNRTDQREERPSKDPIARTETNPFGFSFTISKEGGESTRLKSVAFENAKIELDNASEQCDKVEDVDRWVGVHIALRDQSLDDPFLGATELLASNLRSMVKNDELRDDYPPFESLRLGSPGDIVPEPLPRKVLEVKSRGNKASRRHRRSKPPEEALGPTWDRCSARLPEEARFRVPVVWTPEEEDEFSKAEQEREAHRFFHGLAMTCPSCSRQALAEISPLMMQRTRKYLHDFRVIRRDQLKARAKAKPADVCTSYKRPSKTDVERDADRFLLSLEREGILP